MRSKLLLNYLCLSALSIVHQYSSCLAEVLDSAASLAIEKGYRIDENTRRNDQELIGDNENRKEPIDKQIQTPVRRKRDIGETINSVRFQRESLTNPSREQRFAKRSERQVGIRNSRKLSENNRNVEENPLNSVAKDAGEVGDNQGNNQNKRSLHSSSALAKFKSRSSRVEGSNDAIKSNSDDEELDENSEEYNDETAEEDDEPESVENIVTGVNKDRQENPEESDSDKENADNEYDDFEDQEIGKRETQDSNAVNYEECDSADEESGRNEAQEVALTERKRREERFDGRVKRNDNEVKENEELSKPESIEDPVQDNSKLEGEPEAGKSETEEPNESGENSNVKKDVKLGDNQAERRGSNEGEKSSENSDRNSSTFEKKVEEEIEQKIDSIKEEIKRAVEEREKIREIEINNAKFDELQSETENEEENEENQSLEAADSESEKNPMKRSSKADDRRAKRSESKDLARQLRAVEGVEKLDQDVLAKAKLRHESIKKRSAPVFGDVDSPELLVERNFNPRQVYLSNNEGDDDKGSSVKMSSKAKRSLENNNPMIIPEQAKAKIEDDVPVGFSLDPSVLVGFKKREISRGNPESIGFTRRRRASAIIPEGRVAFLGYRPDQDEGDDDEGGEFEDDGFEDRTSNLREGKSSFTEDSDRANYFLFPGLDRANKEDRSLVRRKRAGSRGGGTTIGRRRARGKAKQLQNVKIASRKKNLMDRDKRQTKINSGSENVASLVGSNQELSPRLATEYREAFGGLQSDPGGALARFKRVKRGVIYAS